MDFGQLEDVKFCNMETGDYFRAEDMKLIYTCLGNACNHERTVAFVLSGYDMSILKEN